jgi:hypothetical protein
MKGTEGKMTGNMNSIFFGFFKIKKIGKFFLPRKNRKKEKKSNIVLYYLVKTPNVFL